MNKKPRFLSKVLGGGLSSNTSNNDSFDASNLESPRLRPSKSQSATYSAGAHITCLDKSSDGQRVVLAGPKIFKVLKVDGSTITEDVDIRAAIISYANTHDPSAATAEQLNIKAVKWSHSSLDGTIITASGNGRVTVYDLNRGGGAFEVARIQDHVRQVHKLAMCPHKDNWLLSASQDGTVRFFDIRSTRPSGNGNTFNAWHTFKCNDAVRDVKWSPSDGHEFACSTDNGTVQKWDIRKQTAPLFKLSAHPTSCRSISWHPDGEHLVSGGADQVCNVWDMSKRADRHQKPRYSFTTPAPIVRVTWRPPCWSATAGGQRAAQVTVAYSETGSNNNQSASVHIWDLARPAMPFKEIEQWDSAPTAMLWNTRDLLWSVDKEGHFTQTDVAFVPKLIDRRSLSTFAFAPTGDALMLLEERQPPRRSRPSITTPEASPSFPHHGQSHLLSLSRSDSEEDVVGSFLGPRPRKGHRRHDSGRNNSTLSTTPPSVNSITDKAMSLDDAVKVTGAYKPQQVMAIGHAPSTAKRNMFKYFSNNYMLPLIKSSKSDETPTDIQIAQLTESFAKTVESVGSYRLAQTWRLLGYTMQLLLSRRAEYHRKSRLTVVEPAKPSTIEQQTMDSAPRSATNSDAGEDTPRKLHHSRYSNDSPLNRGTMSLIAEDIESTSNVATPIVRPVRDHVAHGTHEAMHTSMSTVEDDLSLPEAAHPKTPSPIPVPGAKQSNDEPDSSVEGYDFYGIESFSPAQKYVAPKRKQPLRLDYHEQNSHPPRIQPQRHDSNESFQMFSTSGESQNKFMSSDGSESQSLHGESRSLRDRVHDWESNHSPEHKHRPSVDSTAPGQSISSFGGASQYSSDIKSSAQNGLPFRPSSPPVFRIQEASDPSLSVVRRVRSPPEPHPISPKSSPTPSSPPSQHPNIIPSDYLPWPTDPPFLISPIDPTTLVSRTIDFEIRTSPLHASIMILLLRHLISPTYINPPQANAILQQYQNRLTTMRLFTEATMLRNLCVPEYPDVFAQAQEDVKVGFYCTDCGKAIENDPLVEGSVWRCARCWESVAGCAVCLSRDLDPSYLMSSLSSLGGNDIESGLGLDAPRDPSTWFLCPGCNHGGHVTCLVQWHSGPPSFEGEKFSQGCCPLEGCLHPCLPGMWRDERAEEKKVRKEREMDSLVREGRMVGKGGVRRDLSEVGQSRAVEGARVSLGIRPLALGGDGGGGGGGMGVGVERKRSVKLVAPGDVSLSR